MIKTILKNLLLLLIFSSCASYYQINAEFNKNFESGNIEQAAKILDKDKKAATRKTKFLYFANKGVVEHLLGNYEESNKWLEMGYLFGEDFQRNYLNVAASYFSNPNITVYKGEDHEHLFLLYYKALNYLKLKNYDAALIACRRLTQRLYELGDRYTSENKYQKDAFIQNLIGIIYDASGDYNNAFIAYRNSLEIYKKEFTEMFGIGTPEQLKKDLLRTAALAGFPEEIDRYTSEFGMEYKPLPNTEGGELVFIWHNGLVPIKEEWSINFILIEDAGLVTFENEELGLIFPFPIDTDDDSELLSILENTRIAFPKYVERPPFFHHANLELNNYTYSLEKAEDINAIAFQVLRQRMVEELGKGLLRVALKKAAEKQVEKESENAGTLVGILNFITEQADTRNWQTIPHSIHYSRIPLKIGKNEVTFRTKESENEQIFTFEGIKGETQFQIYRSLESFINF